MKCPTCGGEYQPTKIQIGCTLYYTNDMVAPKIGDVISLGNFGEWSDGDWKVEDVKEVNESGDRVVVLKRPNQ